MNDYKISIIIPIFNVEKYLKAALDSIVNQSIGCENLEVIMVNDCSTDSSGAIIDEYAEKYENFIGIHLEKNSGTASLPMNTGLKRSTAPYLMFLGPDDTFPEEYCKVLYEKIIETDADMVKCNFNLTDDFGNSTLKHSFDKNIDEIVLTSQDQPLKIVSVCNGIHKSSLVKNNNIEFPVGLIAEDMIFTLKEWIFMDKLVYLNQYFGYNYFTHVEDSHSRTPSKKNFYRIIDAFKIAVKIAKEHDREDLLVNIFNQQSKGLFYRAINYPSLNKTEFLKAIYELQEHVGFTFTYEKQLLEKTNQLLMKKQFKLANLFLISFNRISNSDLLYKVISKVK